MGKTNTIPIRVCKEYKDLIDNAKMNRIRLGKSSPLRPPTDARMSLAIARLFKKYPNLKKELDSSDFK